MVLQIKYLSPDVMIERKRRGFSENIFTIVVAYFFKDFHGIVQGKESGKQFSIYICATISPTCGKLLGPKERHGRVPIVAQGYGL